MSRTENHAPTALVTGASRGFGLALTERLIADGWRVIVDGRDVDALGAALGGRPEVVPVGGDVTDALHREALAAAADGLGGLDLLVHNASSLGASPLPALAAYPVATLREVFETNVLAPLALTQLVLPSLRSSGGTIVSISSDAAAEAYPGWGGYGASKAALNQLTAVLAIEEPTIRVYGFDPGDMRTAMHQLAFPGVDISDRPDPTAVVPALLRLLAVAPASGRYRASDLLGAGDLPGASDPRLIDDLLGAGAGAVTR